jgi:hypothetical protein
MIKAEKKERETNLRRNTQSSSETTGTRFTAIFTQTSIISHNHSFHKSSILRVRERERERERIQHENLKWEIENKSIINK